MFRGGRLTDRQTQIQSRNEPFFLSTTFFSHMQICSTSILLTFRHERATLIWSLNAEIPCSHVSWVFLSNTQMVLSMYISIIHIWKRADLTWDLSWPNANQIKKVRLVFEMPLVASGNILTLVFLISTCEKILFYFFTQSFFHAFLIPKEAETLFRSKNRQMLKTQSDNVRN